ncbi:MAG: methyltransferase domain-containing protein [Thermoplasmata archaeon]|nr:methyltransferase domain-containing protein [Thermoplasmata archaeon]
MPETTHAVAHGFDRAAVRYERGRPDYAVDAVAHLAEALSIAPGRTVVDVGAGTGKFTRELLRFGPQLTAVEPMPGMRAQFALQLPKVRLLEGTAEHLPFAEGSVDTIVCAQAFHWFDTEAASREFKRVLRPGGGLGLIWNVRDERVPWVGELTRILDRHDAGGPRGRSEAWRAPLESTGLFAPLAHRTFPHAQRATPEGIVDRALSVSFIAMLPTADQEAVAQEVRNLLARALVAHPGAIVELPYRTEVYWTHATARGDPPRT